MISKDIQKVLISEDQIEERCEELAKEIENDYNAKGEIPIIVGLLKGSVPFMAELIKRFTFAVKSTLCLLALMMVLNQSEMCALTKIWTFLVKDVLS